MTLSRMVIGFKSPPVAGAPLLFLIRRQVARFICLELESVTGYITKVAETDAACQTAIPPCCQGGMPAAYFSFWTLISLKYTTSLSLWFCRPM